LEEFAMRQSRRHWTLLMLLLTIAGCSKLCGVSHTRMNPDQVVEAYLNRALNMTSVSQRADLMEYTTGNLKASIAQASDEVIRAAYVDKRYKIESYSVIERRDRTPRQTEITFRLVYRDLGTDGNQPPSEAPMVTTENTVDVVRENKLWLIRDVLGNKATIDFPLAQAARIDVKPGTVTRESPPAE